LGAAVPRQQEDEPETLLAEAELLDNAFVAIGIVLLEVVEQATPLADQHEKAAARAVIFLVRFEVFRQLTNALA
jgi:hypothetical protein